MQSFQTVGLKMLCDIHFILLADLRRRYVHGLLQVCVVALVEPGDHRVPFIHLKVLQVLFVLQKIYVCGMCTLILSWFTHIVLEEHRVCGDEVEKVVDHVQLGEVIGIVNGREAERG